MPPVVITKPSPLIEWMEDNYGLFAVEAIMPGTIICSLSDDQAKLMNDGAANLLPVVRASHSTEFYQALIIWERNFPLSGRNNITITENGQCVAARHIAAGEELLRPYSLVSWICQIIKFVTVQTFPGYVKFFHEMSYKLKHHDLLQINAVFAELFATYGYDLENLDLDAAEQQLRVLNMNVLRQHLLS